jgi:hypothetical protein
LPSFFPTLKVIFMSVDEILDQLPKLKVEERRLLFERLRELEPSGADETPEMLTAIDAGLRSLEQHGGVPIEDVQARLEARWRTG